jgi:hypothetical protein
MARFCDDDDDLSSLIGEKNLLFNSITISTSERIFNYLTLNLVETESLNNQRIVSMSENLYCSYMKEEGRDF